MAPVIRISLKEVLPCWPCCSEWPNIAPNGAADAVLADVTFTLSPLARMREIAGQRFGPLRQLAPSVFTSMLLNFALLGMLASVPLAMSGQDAPRELTLSVLDQAEEPEPDYEPMLKLAPPDEKRLDRALSATATSSAPITNNELDLLTVPVRVDLEAIAVQPYTPPPLEGFRLDEVVIRQGRVGEEIATVEGAVDRITYEIAKNLEDGGLLVVWMMDASISLVEERQQVADNLQRVYDELDDLGSVPKDELLAAVVAYGKAPRVMVEPTAKAHDVVHAIRDVPTDESGIENVFSALLASVDRYRSLITRERRKMIIVIWTDESGDDYARVDEAVSVCQRMAIPVFTVGPSAMFGKEKGTRPYKHPEDGKTYYLPLNRGPDAVHQEQVQIPFWFKGSQLRSLHAGLGPFALTRLARESGGAYFIKDAAGGESPFELHTMLRYVPGYDSVNEYVTRINHSKMRLALMRAVEITMSRKLKGTPRLEFAPDGNNFQDQLREAQQTVAYNSAILDQALAPFGAEGFEHVYEKERSPRWRAWYDLNYGRLLAMRVRCDEYNWACAVMKGKGREFVERKSNRWRFVPSANIEFGSATQRQAAEAQRLLRRCVENNPGTPWALLAQRELRYPLGFTVEERYAAPPPPKRKSTKAKPKPRPNNKRRVEKARVLERPKPVKLPKL